jgi:hypothetical protein
MRLVPITLSDAKSFIGRHHRHCIPPVGWKFGVGLWTDQLVGVCVAGRCVARKLDKPENIEITRVCVIDIKNGNSRLYGAICRASAALGYSRAYTYTLANESGASLLAAGFTRDAVVAPSVSWGRVTRHRVSVDLFGNEIRDTGEKIRWVRYLNSGERREGGQ